MMSSYCLSGDYQSKYHEVSIPYHSETYRDLFPPLPGMHPYALRPHSHQHPLEFVVAFLFVCVSHDASHTLDPPRMTCRHLRIAIPSILNER